MSGLAAKMFLEGEGQPGGIFNDNGVGGIKVMPLPASNSEMETTSRMHMNDMIAEVFSYLLFTFTGSVTCCTPNILE